jgi:hypothetical protein
MSRHSNATESNHSLTFVFPVRAMQLCEQPTDPSQFWVLDRINVQTISSDRLQQEIDMVMERLSGNKAVQILQNDIFDTIYSVLFYLQDVSLQIRKEIIQILEIGLKNVVQYMQRSKVLQWAEANFITVDYQNDDPNLRLVF